MPTLRRLVLVIFVPLLAFAAEPARADEPLPIFDAHLHYNWEPQPYLPLDRVIRLFEDHRVTGILANSRPNDGTRALVEGRPATLRVVPFLRPYRVRDDVHRWFRDPATLELIDEEFRRGDYVGIGEFHLHGQEARTEVVRKIVDFARRHRLFLHAHSDVEALAILFEYDPQARIVWAHTGFSLAATEVEVMLRRYPNLWAELSYRSGITGAGGQLTPEWRALFERYADRFLLGSDTWTNERWDAYGATMATYRAWLAQLPPEAAAAIASGNGRRLFGR